ncbi:MAG: glycosyltransferase family 4 protein [Candidatus Tectomicrobia bacterium]|nr:glycosyltransferase family 4 protein [Candidatus Tectomicrobia bacterium]
MSLAALPARLACRFPSLLAVALKRRRAAASVPRVHYGYWQPGPGGPSRKIERLAERFPHTPRGFNLLYTVNGNYCPVGLATAASRAGIPLVFNANGLHYKAWFGDGWEGQNARLRRIYQRAAYVLYQSEFSRACARRFLGADPCPGEVLYNAVDVQRFQPRKARSWDPRRPVFLTTGVFVRFERLEPAVRAVAALVRGGCDARLLIAGELRFEGGAARLAALLEEEGVAERVELLPPYSLAEAPSIYQRADLFLHMKYNDPCPSVVIEAMACGLPVVCAGTGGTPELIGEEEAGVAVPSVMDWDVAYALKPADVLAGIERLLRDYEGFSHRARQRALTRYAGEPWYARHGEVFQALLEGGNAAVRGSA